MDCSCALAFSTSKMAASFLGRVCCSARLVGASSARYFTKSKYISSLKSSLILFLHFSVCLIFLRLPTGVLHVRNLPFVISLHLVYFVQFLQFAQLFLCFLVFKNPITILISSLVRCKAVTCILLGSASLTAKF